MGETSENPSPFDFQATRQSSQTPVTGSSSNKTVSSSIEKFQAYREKLKQQLQVFFKTEHKDVLDLLVHAFQCDLPECQDPDCLKVKDMYRNGIQCHGTACRSRASRGCALCTEMWYFLQIHARNCKKEWCYVPQCRYLKDCTKMLQNPMQTYQQNLQTYQQPLQTYQQQNQQAYQQPLQTYQQQNQQAYQQNLQTYQQPMQTYLQQNQQASQQRLQTYLQQNQQAYQQRLQIYQQNLQTYQQPLQGVLQPLKTYQQPLQIYQQPLQKSFPQPLQTSQQPLQAETEITRKRAAEAVPDTINGSRQFKITGYSSLSKVLGIGEHIALDSFNVGGHTWAIYFYPHGKYVEDDGAYVSLFIALASEATDVKAIFELALLDQSGKERHKVHSHFGRTLENGPFTLKYRGSIWGYKRFFKRTALEVSDYLKDDCLIVQCKVGVVNSHTKGPEISVPPSDISQHNVGVLESGNGTNVNFGPTKDQNTQGIIKIEDMETQVFKHRDMLDTMTEQNAVAEVVPDTMDEDHSVAEATRDTIDEHHSVAETALDTMDEQQPANDEWTVV